jgi:hypothetical protein
MFVNGANKFSEAILTAGAKALAIMAVRFVPQSYSCFYSAQSIGVYLQGLQFGNSSALYAEIDYLKLGLMNRSFRTFRSFSRALLIREKSSLRQYYIERRK